MRDLIPYIGDKTARDAWDRVFSRQMLGSILVGSAAGKVVEQVVVLIAGSSRIARLFGWMIAFIIFVAMFVYWHRLSDVADEVKEKAEE